MSQEVVLAPRVEIACGNRRISEFELMKAQQVLTKGCYIIFHSEVIQSSRFTSRDIESMLTMLRMRTHFQQGKKLDKLSTLSLTRESLASDPRDYLFAKYGVMGKKALYMYTPDFTVPLAIICKQFCRAYIETKRDLSIFCYAGG